ncbi:MAG: PQQ-dependent sugar dehydrogenase, partial [Dehalococcoidia bacterium]
MRHALLRLALLALAALAVACGVDGPREPASVRLVPALGGAVFDWPVEIGAYPDGRLFVAEQGGRAWLVTADGDRAPLLDLRARVDAERGEGLLSLALDPGFEENGRLWAFYFASGDPPRAVLARFEVRDGAADLDSELVVLEVEQPGFNQNGAAVRFGTDGMLYLSLGDGSASADPFDQGQDPSTLLATVLRIDVRASTEAEPYRVPDDNPFLGEPGVRPEIYAYGFRNPFRMDIDAATGEIWLGDVGISAAEEVNRVEAGGNYGWSVVEGERCLDRTECDQSAFVAPVLTYGHEEGRCAVIGGVVYRGDAIAGLAGRYLYADLCSGEVWAL